MDGYLQLEPTPERQAKVEQSSGVVHSTYGRVGGPQMIKPLDPAQIAGLGAMSPKASWWFWAAIGGTALMLIGAAVTRGDDRVYMEG